ncbi:hypothetical protein TWF569_005971 [Orbilia oligospora]|nr:hypothetical protein TWF569_005971 [Orbilia oligospora]
MSQPSNKSEPSDGRPRKRGRPPSIHSNSSTSRQALMKKRKETLTPKKQPKPVIPITQNIILLESESPDSSQQTSGNQYNDAICVVCWMPFCIRHSFPAPRRHPPTSTKWALKRDDTRNSHDARGRPAFVPCSHEGACDPKNSNCCCRDESVYCEKFCECPADCPRRWKGCTCKSSNPCTGGKCPCVRENRECDPDLCLSCGADEQLDPIHQRCRPEDESVASVVASSTTKRDVRLTACQNVFLQLKEPPMTKVGPTSMPFKGNGLFAMEPIKKGSFVGEYTGEVIPEGEANRRVDTYDSSTISFLFEINSTHEIDSTHYGNKTRYLNHSELEPNCGPKVLLVNGIHRIAFRALEDIEPGQELTFNYGENPFQFEAVEREGAAERSVIKNKLQRLKETLTRTESDLEAEDDISTDGREERRPEITTRRHSRLQSRRRRLLVIPDSDDESSDYPIAVQLQCERDK